MQETSSPPFKKAEEQVVGKAEVAMLSLTAIVFPERTKLCSLEGAKRSSGPCVTAETKALVLDVEALEAALFNRSPCRLHRARAHRIIRFYGFWPAGDNMEDAEENRAPNITSTSHQAILTLNMTSRLKRKLDNLGIDPNSSSSKLTESFCLVSRLYLPLYTNFNDI